MYVGWRSTMVVLAVVGTMVYLLVLLLVPETLNKERARTMKFSPFAPLKLVLSPRIFCITLTGGATLSTLFLTTFCISTVIADANNLNPFVIGLSIVPTSVSAVVFSTIGGKISDILGKRFGRGARLLFSTICFIISSLMLIPFAYSFTSSLWAPIVISVVMGAFRGSAGPGFSTFCIEEHPQNVSAVLGGLSSGYMVIVSSIRSNSCLNTLPGFPNVAHCTNNRTINRMGVGMHHHSRHLPHSEYSVLGIEFDNCSPVFRVTIKKARDYKYFDHVRQCWVVGDII